MVIESSGAVVTVASGLFVSLLGWFIRNRGGTFLIAGYDDTSDVPSDVAGSIVGNMALRVGVATVALGLLLAADLSSTLVVWAFVAAIAVELARVFYRLRTYSPLRPA